MAAHNSPDEIFCFMAHYMHNHLTFEKIKDLVREYFFYPFQPSDPLCFHSHLFPFHFHLFPSIFLLTFFLTFFLFLHSSYIRNLLLFLSSFSFSLFSFPFSIFFLFFLFPFLFPIFPFLFLPSFFPLLFFPLSLLSPSLSFRSREVVSPVSPVLSCPGSMPCGWATPKTTLWPFQGLPARRVGDLRPSSIPLDTPRPMGLVTTVLMTLVMLI
jgi:hypothetical protein